MVFSNTQAKIEVNRNLQTSKLNSRIKKIDGTVATIIAYVTLTRYKLDYENFVKLHEWYIAYLGIRFRILPNNCH